MLKQPDFGQLFRETFAADKHPVRYSVRSDGNLLHDLAFMSSLVHDARLINWNAQAHDGNLTLELNRDCWELGYHRKEKSSELYLADSILKLTGVQAVEWNCEGHPKEEPWIEYLWIDPGFRHNERFNFYLVGDHWKCTINLLESQTSIELHDTNSPYLWSERTQ
jgi:hypothetical protein